MQVTIPWKDFATLVECDGNGPAIIAEGYLSDAVGSLAEMKRKRDTDYRISLPERSQPPVTYMDSKLEELLKLARPGVGICND